MTFRPPAGSRSRTASAVAALLVLLAVCTGCSKDAEEKASPEQVLAAAKDKLDQTSGVNLTLATDKLPDGVQGVLNAKGVGTHAPAFDGSIKVFANGLSADVPVVAVGGTVYAKLPFTTSFVEVNPADYGAPDPSNLMATDSGISSWLTALEKVQAGDQVRDGDAVLTTYSGSLPGKAVAAVIPSADDAATFEATFQLDDQGQLVKGDVSGPFYGKAGDVEYTVTVADYGTERTITKP